MNTKRMHRVSAVLLLVSLLLLTGGSSYAFFTYVGKGNTSNTVTTGNLTFLYDEQNKQGNGIRLVNAFPTSDTVGKGVIGESNVFDFQVLATTKGAPISYEVVAEKQASSTLPDKMVKVYLTTLTGNVETEIVTTVKDNIVTTYNELVDTSIVGQVGKTIYQEIIPQDQTNYQKQFRLRMWLSDKAQEQTDGEWNYNDKNFSIKVNVFANASKVESPKPEVAMMMDFDLLGADCTKYYSNVQNVVIADHIDIPSEAVASFDASAKKDKSVMLWITGPSTGYTLTVAGEGGVKANPEDDAIFNSFPNAVSMDLSKLDTSELTSMKSMFHGCSKLTVLDISNFDTSKVTTMENMFCECSSLTTLDLRHFDMSQVTNMTYMFSGCTSLVSLDVSTFNTSKVTDMLGTFQWCNNLTSLDLSSFDTSNVTVMDYMFENCQKLVDLNISSFRTHNVTGMLNMFKNCSSIKSLNLNHFDTSKVASMDMMFYDCSNLTNLEVKNFDTSASNEYGLGGMFDGCSRLTSITLGTKWSKVSYAFGSWESSQTIYVEGKTSVADFTKADQGWEGNAKVIYLG